MRTEHPLSARHRWASAHGSAEPVGPCPVGLTVQGADRQYVSKTQESQMVLCTTERRRGRVGEGLPCAIHSGQVFKLRQLIWRRAAESQEPLLP